MKLDDLSTITTAIKYLTKQTGQLWTEKELLQAAMYNSYLYAIPDKASPVVVNLYDFRSVVSGNLVE